MRQPKSKTSVPMEQATARGTIECTVPTCGKKRLVFSRYKKQFASAETQAALQKVKEASDFTCGATLFGAEDFPDLTKTVIANPGLSCGNHVEYAFYSKKKSGRSVWKPVCCWCADEVTPEQIKKAVDYGKAQGKKTV